MNKTHRSFEKHYIVLIQWLKLRFKSNLSLASAPSFLSIHNFNSYNTVIGKVTIEPVAFACAINMNSKIVIQVMAEAMVFSQGNYIKHASQSLWTTWMLQLNRPISIY